MQRIAVIFAVSITGLLCGCGGPTGTPRTSSSPTSSSTAPQTPDIAGNWQFSMTSSTPGTRPFSIGGGINQAGAAASGGLHVEGSNCFDRLITRSVTGTVASGSTSLTVTGSDGQIVTLTGNFTNPTYVYGTVINDVFTGTYRVDGGCAAGDQGTVSGLYIITMGNQLSSNQFSGAFSSGSTQQVFHVTSDFVQSGSADPTGSFEVSGTKATFDTPCMGVGTIKAGAYPSGSFILGTSVGLEFDTASGILTFLGTLAPDGTRIVGTYTISGSACDDTGTAVITVSTSGNGYWDY